MHRATLRRARRRIQSTVGRSHTHTHTHTHSPSHPLFPQGRLEYAEQRRAERAAAYEAQWGVPAPESALRGRGRGGRRSSASSAVAPPRPPSGRKRGRRGSEDEDVDAAVSDEEGYEGGYEYGSGEVRRDVLTVMMMWILLC